jgi:hypothetical protein
MEVIAKEDVVKALVVYESMFGNTEQVARAISIGLEKHTDVQVRAVDDEPASISDSFDLIVIGGPTHAFSMSRPKTREDALRRGATEGKATIGIREWIDHLHSEPDSQQLVATFDTRVKVVEHLPGSAARAAAKAARHRGFARATKPQSFYVEDVAGPLVDGELARAEEWGNRLGNEAKDLRHTSKVPEQPCPAPGID